MQAEKLVERGEYDAAIKTYETVLAREPNNVRAQAGVNRARRAKAAEHAVSCEKPLSEQNVAALLSRHVPEARARQYITACGINFTLTPKISGRLRALGASDALIRTLDEAKPWR